MSSEEASPASNLPSEVLAIVFSFLAFRPRLLVLTRVCKRWKTGAYASIQEVPPSYRQNRTVPWQLFQITHWRGGPSDTPRFPKRLSSLEVPATASLKVWEHLSSLSKVLIDTFPDPARAVPHLETVTHLEVRFAQRNSLTAFNALRLPNLRSLILGEDFSSSEFILVHYTSLTRLSIPALKPRSLLLINSTNLTSLTIATFSLSDLSLAWLQSQTSLRALRIESVNESATLDLVESFVEHFAPILLHYALPTNVQRMKRERFLALLARCTRLERLNFQPSHAVFMQTEVVAALTQLAGSLTTLHINTAAGLIHCALACTRLTHLEFHLLPPTLLSYRLPYLRELRCRNQISLSTLQSLIKQFPSLSRLVPEGGVDIGQQMAMLQETIKLADQNAMSLLIIGERELDVLRAAAPNLLKSLKWLEVNCLRMYLD